MRAWLTDHVVEVLLGVAGLLGTGTVAGYFDGAREMVAAYPAQVAGVALIAFSLGGYVGCAPRWYRLAAEREQDRREREKGEREARRKEREHLQRYIGLPPQLMSMVREAYEEGVCRRDVKDTYGLMLAKMGLFTVPPVLPYSDTVDLMLPPAERVFVDAHRDEVFSALAEPAEGEAGVEGQPSAGVREVA